MADWVIPSSSVMAQTQSSDSNSEYRMRIRVVSPKTLKRSERSQSSSSGGISCRTACKMAP